ncbi:hypothetical protein [Geoalkalibacter halelectricus]|uniref:DAHP synthase ferredoxin-like domain-containing protein n=1 Tax=Geoalkalibacter halelectricus TaxID=2847045 RepID=A0ABY5ZTS8_9BACT|nr:hypothetical protein [Geoalkalibacter halelectricus]MDO3379870.1 hypothetical protein [Geoalkalibacter halelectricus]UWZ80601.1 hypothetical protein L9S41_04180 [Geoalkalibacter halelectricus]
MLVVMKKSATEADMRGVKQFLVERDFDFHQSTGANRTIIGVIGETHTIDREELKKLPGVLEVFKIPEEE